MMNRRLSNLSSLAGLSLTLLGLGPGIPAARTQETSALIQFTSVWKYDQSGLELGTDWRTNTYDDAAWPLGPGLLGFDSNFPYPVQVNTPLMVSSTITNYYFRTTFQFTGDLVGLSLVASNLVDDGCVIYLNGVEATRLRVPANQNASTPASSGPSVEGQIEVLTMPDLALLRQGENLLAAEV